MECFIFLDELLGDNCSPGWAPSQAGTVPFVDVSPLLLAQIAFENC